MYTPESIKDAKADRTAVNKWDKQLGDAFVTASGRLDCEVLQTFAAPEKPACKRYSFWVEFTPEDIAWFKRGAAERGFRYGSVK